MKRLKIAVSTAVCIASVALIAVIAGVACDDDLLPPEIWIDISPVYVGKWSTAEDAGPNDFDLQLTNRGEDTLKIEQLLIKGDENCAFKFKGPDINELNENESAFIRGWYQPTTPAERWDASTLWRWR